MGPVSVTQSKLCNARCWSNCSLIPPTIALVASLVAVVTAIYWKSYYLCIPFGLGALGSTYAVGYTCLTRDATNLTKQLTQQHETTRQELEKLQALNTQTEEQHKEAIRQLEQSCRDRELQIQEAQKQNLILEQRNERLTELLATFQNDLGRLKGEITYLEGFRGLITEMQQIAVQNKGQIAQYQPLLEKANLVLQSLDSLHKIVAKCNITNQIEELSQLNSQLLFAASQLAAIQGAVSALQEIRNELSQDVSQFTTALPRLERLIDTITRALTSKGSRNHDIVGNNQ